MKITHIYADVSGVSHFQELGNVHFEPLNNKPAWGHISKALEATEITFYRFGPEVHYDWHVPVIGRFIEIYLDGCEEVEAGDGTKKKFGKGDIVLFDDLTGKGHRATGLEAGFSILLKTDLKDPVKALQSLTKQC